MQTVWLHMPAAILYVRVSTDEQKKGYSPKYQEDLLKNYCAANNIDVIEIYTEDYSAKNFRRPAWSRLIKELKRADRSSPLQLLFTKWDRFSRNAADSYLMLRTLNELNVTAQAIEQPVDYNLPEGKILLAMYVSLPEAENDRRGSDVKKGMRKAQEEGRWMGSAPLGYSNIFTAKGEKMIIPLEPACSIIKYLFHRMAAGEISVTELFNEAKQKGLQCSRTNFYRLLQSPVYAGFIVVAADKVADRKTVIGQHTGLVNIETFKAVQSLFNKRTYSGRGRKFNPLFEFKGYLSCPFCSKMLTASASKGRRERKYYYYHCVAPCRFRIRCDEVNSSFNAFISHLRPQPRYEEMCRQCVISMMTRKGQQFQNSQVKKTRKVAVFTNRLQTILSLLQDNSFDYRTYLSMKNDLEEKIRMMAEAIKLEQEAFGQLMAGAERTIHLLGHLDELYRGLTDPYKPKFFAWLFKKGVGWPLEEWGEIMRTPPQVMYGTHTTEDANEKDLRKLAEVSCQTLVELLQEEMVEMPEF